MTAARLGLGGLALCALLAGLSAPVYSQSPSPAPDALQSLEAEALAGSAEAQLALADAFDTGRGALPDYKLAQRWYQAASEQGVARATLMLGRYARSGLTGPADAAQAMAYFETAAAQGEVQAFIDLGLLHERDVLMQPDGAAARSYYEAAVAQGSLPAMARLGTLLYEGTLVPQDLDQARALFLQAARAGNAQAQNNLGLMFVRGEGVAQDYEAAALWFELAAAQGERSAMRNLGTLYDNGFGVPQSDEAAKRWYRMAADAVRGPQVEALETAVFDPWLSGAGLAPEDVPAARSRAALGDAVAHYRLGLTALAASPPAFPKAVSHFQQAAGAGYAPAMINLGLLYQQGNGVIEDFSQAYALFSRAGLAGLPAAAPLRESLTGLMAPEQVLEAQALAAGVAQESPAAQ